MSDSFSLDDSLLTIKGIGQAQLDKFDSINVRNIADLIDYFPRKYIDYSNLSSINQLQPGEICIKAKIDKVSNRYSRRGLVITEATAFDDSGVVKIIWFNQAYRKKSIVNDRDYLINGRFGLFSGRLVINNPSLEQVSDFPVNGARIVPIYKASKLISSRLIRLTIAKIFRSDFQLPEYLPPDIVKKNNLMDYSKTIKQIHFPDSFSELERAKHRIAFNEVINLFLASHLNRQQLALQHALKISPNLTLINDFIERLPFHLTDSQKQIAWQIMLDFQKEYPMNRLVEGDVGSGKTIVALLSSISLVSQGYQVCFLAPTEVLARQHYETISSLLKVVNLDQTVEILIGSTKAKDKILIKQKIKDNQILLIIGTHALLQDDVQFGSLALVIVDEQHRFGVKQRQALQQKTTYQPHLLALSATPIPRSLALTVFGELSISRLTEKPAGTKDVTTEIVTENNLQKVYDFTKSRLNQGEQVFIVCPAIIEDNFLSGKSVETIYRDLKSGVFKDYKLGLIHGQLKANLKNEVMDNFVNHRIDILIATTVIEVGVDVPNATVMIIMNADQFGLAQIHQLRGRVGRGQIAGYCFLVGDNRILQNDRIKILKKYNDGFYLAEEDLKLRGPGAIYGQTQHGSFDLRFANLDDHDLLQEARLAAQDILKLDPKLVKYKELKKKIENLNNISRLN